MTTTNTALFASSTATMNFELFLLRVSGLDTETLISSLRSSAVLAIRGLTEICLRNPLRIEGSEFSFSRRDRGMAFALVEKYLDNPMLLSENDWLKVKELAYRYRKQILRLIPSCPEVTIEETETEIVL